MVKINNLPLPNKLVQLVKKGQWMRPTDWSKLNSMTNFINIDDLNFLGYEGMEQESQPSNLVKDEKLAQIYGLGSSLLTGQEITNPRIIDIDKSVVIAVNYDEDVICLDYREDLTNPKVSANQWNEDQKIWEWKTIAPDFATFWEAIAS